MGEEIYNKKGNRISSVEKLQEFQQIIGKNTGVGSIIPMSCNSFSESEAFQS